jgi:glycosyltransferase involved in cell wall biosynthesis
MLDSIQVIILALDEEETMGGVVTQLREMGLARVRVVDNGNTVHTVAVAREAGAEVITEGHRGYGQACWSGYQQLDDAVAWVLFCDADESDDLADVLPLVAEAEHGADFVLGNRRASARARGAMTPVQQFGNGLATTLMRWGWGHRFGDLGPCGARCELLRFVALVLFITRAQVTDLLGRLTTPWYLLRSFLRSPL